MPYYTDIIGGGIGTEPDGYERNDDDFFGPFDLGFTLTYFGEEYTEFYINNNGDSSIEVGATITRFDGTARIQTNLNSSCYSIV